jgi:hypothetical protein
VSVIGPPRLPANVWNQFALLGASMRAGRPHRQYAYGGADWGKSFVLDEDGTLTEYLDTAPVRH